MEIGFYSFGQKWVRNKYFEDFNSHDTINKVLHKTKMTNLITTCTGHPNNYCILLSSKQNSDREMLNLLNRVHVIVFLVISSLEIQLTKF